MSLRDDLVRALQFRLQELGFYHLRIDGLPGNGTESAIVRFKEVNGLRARSFVGPTTLSRLFSAEAIPAAAPVAIGDDPPWLTEARRWLGKREVPGPGNNPDIMQWAVALDQWYPGDDTPWCGLFVAHCMAAGAPNEPQDFNRLGARQWIEYGVEADAGSPPLGSICVLWRTHPTKSWNGHVFIVTGQSGTALRGIGGNQSDSVSETWFDRNRVLGVRVPEGFTGVSAPFAQTGALSTREA